MPSCLGHMARARLCACSICNWVCCCMQHTLRSVYVAAVEADVWVARAATAAEQVGVRSSCMGAASPQLWLGIHWHYWLLLLVLMLLLCPQHRPCCALSAPELNRLVFLSLLSLRKPCQQPGTHICGCFPSRLLGNGHRRNAGCKSRFQRQPMDHLGYS